MNPPVTCRCCSAPTKDLCRVFDDVLGAVCPDCAEMSKAADAALRRVGVEGCVAEPERYKTEP